VTTKLEGCFYLMDVEPGIIEMTGLTPVEVLLLYFITAGRLPMALSVPWMVMALSLAVSDIRFQYQQGYYINALQLLI